MEKVVSQVEQRWNDADFIFARDVGTAWEIETLVLEDPKCTKGVDRNVVCGDEPERLKDVLWGYVPGVGGRNHGKINSLYVTGIHHDAGILLHEGAHLYDNPWHQLGNGDGLCGGGAYWDYNDVAFMVRNRKARYNETNFPCVVYGSPLPPRATDDFANTRKDTPVTIDVLENDYDGNGDTLSLQAVVPKSEKGGTCALSKDGKQVVYTPAPGYVGQDKFTYTVVDSTGEGNRSGQVKVSVGDNGLMVHFDFEEAESESIEERQKTAPPDDEYLWLYGLVDSRPKAEQVMYHFRNQGPYNNGSVGTAHWTGHFPVQGVRGKGLWNPGLFHKAHVRMYEVGDPGRGSLSASVWVLYPPGGGGGVILCKGGAPFNFVNGWMIAGGGIGANFQFSGNVTRVREDEVFSLTSEEKIEANKWYHLVMIMDREKKQLRAWVNNKEVAPDANVRIPDGVIEYWTPMVVFNRFTGKWWSGTRALVDEVKLFTSVLTPGQIAELHAEGKDAKVPEFPDPTAKE